MKRDAAPGRTERPPHGSSPSLPSAGVPLPNGRGSSRLDPSARGHEPVELLPVLGLLQLRHESGEGALLLDELAALLLQAVQGEALVGVEGAVAGCREARLPAAKGPAARPWGNAPVLLLEILPG